MPTTFKSCSSARRWFFLLAVLGLIAPWAEAQLSLNFSILDQPVTASKSGRSGAVGKVTASVPMGAAISVRMELTNTGSAPVDVMPSLDPAAGFLLLHLITPEGKSNRFTAIRWETRDILLKQRPLAPGARLSFETFLYGKLPEQGLQQRYLFDQPGRHGLYAEYVVEKLGVRVRSDVVVVEVGAPVVMWDQLKQAGIVDLMEGRVRSRQAVSNRVAQIDAIIDAQREHPLKEWVRSKSEKAPAGGTRQ